MIRGRSTPRSPSNASRLSRGLFLVADTTASNLLLAALSPEDYARVAATLEMIQLKPKDILHDPGQPIRHVYFPGDGFCSVLSPLEDGAMVEVATIGREGMVGVFELKRPPASVTIVQMETDTCVRMTVGAFRREMDVHGAFYQVLTNYSCTLVSLIMHSSACHAVHSVEQRLARWLLVARDRTGRADFRFTHDLVAMMLGATRPTVTVIAGSLQKAGLIAYRRGHIAILDHTRLEGTSCACYGAAKKFYRS